MGAIVLDASKVNSYVLPNLVKSQSIMQDAYSTSVSLKNSLPSSFIYRSIVSEIVNQIYNIRREISDVNTIVSKKINKAKSIESKNESRANKISSMVSKIGAVGGTIGGAAIGAATSGVVGAAVGGIVGNKVGKTIADTGATVASKVVSGVKKLGTSIVDGFKWVGSKITSAYKSATSWISDRAKKVSDWVSEKFESVKNWTSQALKDTGAWISKTAKSAWAWIKGAASTVWEHMKKLGASIVNGVIALVKGVVKLIEAIGDLVILIGAGIGTIGTALYDIGKGIITGNWDWSATKGLWDGTKSVVAYDWTSKCIFDPLYSTGFGKWLDENAYAPFKSDGLGCKILEGVGYVAGIVVISIFTFGAGGVAIGTTATIGSVSINAGAVGLTALAAGIGKHTQNAWNENSISINYGGQDMDIAIDYNKYSEIEKLKQGESTTITQQIILEDGSKVNLEFKITSKGNGQYDIIDSEGNTAKVNGLKESSTAGGLAKGVVGGIGDGFKYYTAVSTLGNVQKFAGMAKNLGGIKAIFKNFGYKQSFKSLAKNSAKQTFTDIGFYIDSGTHIYTDVKSGIETGEWNLFKTGAKIVGAYGINFLGNLGGNYFKTGLDKSVRELNKVKTLGFKEQSVLDFYNKHHPEEQFSTFNELKTKHPDIVSDITMDEYRIRVLDENVEYDTRKTIAKELYEEENGYGTFDKLSYTDQKAKMNSLDTSSEKYQEILSEKIGYYTKIADDTILEVDRLKKIGAIKDEYSTDDVIRMIEDDIPQTEYLTKQYVDDYYSNFNIKDGKATVVAFQNGDGKNFAGFGGQVGASDGMYVMPKKDADDIIKAALRDDGTLDPAVLKEKLGGVEMGDNVVVISREVSVEDLKMPKGSLSTAYVGHWKPGGMTTGGTVEAVIPPTTYLDTDDGFSITAYGNKQLDDYVKVIINGK